MKETCFGANTVAPVRARCGLSQIVPILDDGLFRQVLTIVKPARTCELLEILRARIVALSEASDTDIAGPDGRLLAHRLASEAGLLGFRRLSLICRILESQNDRSASAMAEPCRQLRAILSSTHAEARARLAALAVSNT